MNAIPQRQHGDLPPHDPEAERAVIGAALLGGDVPDLEAEMFLVENHRLIWRTIRDLRSKGHPTDIVTTKSHLEGKDLLKKVGGVSDLSSLIDHTPDVANVEHYAELVRTKWREREQRRLGLRLANGEDLTAIVSDLMALSAPPMDESEASSARSWPTLQPEALHGLAGEVVAAIEPHTESDPVAVLAQFLMFFGACAGRGPCFMVEADRHGVNEYAVLVGRSSRARKGTSLGHVRQLFDAADPGWTSSCIANGLSSGEGLIWAVRDPVVRTKVKDGVAVEIVEDDGVPDKRLLVIESEYGSLLKVMSRLGSTTSPVIRDAWDGHSLRSLVKNCPARSTDPHISILGHITETELRTLLNETEAANGFGNRVLWLCVRRSKELPEGGSLIDRDLSSFVRRLKSVLAHARRTAEVKRDDEARALWRRVYSALSTDHPGLLGAMIARSEAHVTRLSMIYALLDESKLIRAEHLRAALALWEYSEASARYIFGDALGDPVADRILEIVQTNPDGITQTEIHRALGNNQSARRIGECLKQLEDMRLVYQEKRKTGGRPAVVWRPVGR